MKDDVQEKISGCKDYKEVAAAIDDFMDYYNKDRYQWDLLKLSPDEFYEYLTTGIYPLPLYDPDSKN